MSADPNKNYVEELEQAAAGWVFRRDVGLTPEEEAEFERWREEDPRHLAALIRHDRAWSALDRPRQGGQSAFVLQALARRARRRQRRLGVAGSVFVLLIAAGFVWQSHRPPVAAPARARVVLPAKQTLSDGSVVELNAGAEIAVDFTALTRSVTLKGGEAHFQVAPEQRPFVVTAQNIEFRAVGTAFSVQFADRKVELLVTEGRVAVEKSGANSSVGPPLAGEPAGPTKLATVSAGNRMVVAFSPEASAPVAAPVVVASDDMAERLAWRVPKLDLTETPLAEAIALLNQYNRVRFVIDDAELGRVPVSGLFRADRTEAFVRILEANFGVRAEQAGDTVRLHRKQ